MKRIFLFTSLTFAGVLALSLFSTFFVQQKRIAVQSAARPTVFSAENIGRNSLSSTYQSLFNIYQQPVRFSSAEEGLAFLDANENVKNCPLPPPMDENTCKAFVRTTKEVLLSLASHEFQDVYNRLAFPLKKQITAEDIRSQWISLTKETGPFLETTAASVGECLNERYVYLTVRFESTKLDAKASFDGMNNIIALAFEPTIVDPIQPSTKQFNKIKFEPVTETYESTDD